jgi:hypothetical protein
MPLPLGRADTVSQSSHDPFENVPVLSGALGPRPLSQSGAPLSSNTHLTPAAQHTTSPRSQFLFPESVTGELSPRASPNSSAMNSPLPSRSPSPFLPFYSSAPSSASDTDSDDPVSPLLLDTYSAPHLREGRLRWWNLRKRSRRGPRRSSAWGYRSMVRVVRRVFRHPFFPKHPSTIVRLSPIIELVFD